MDFIEKIRMWKERKPGHSIINDFGNELICHVNEKNKADFLHVIYNGLTCLQKECLIESLKATKIVEERSISEYIDLLCSANGMVLYSGSFVIFGVTDEKSEELFSQPASLMRMNDYDGIAQKIKELLYIGNAMHLNHGNIKFYLNLTNGSVNGFYRDNVTIKWGSITQFLEYIFEKYDSNYLDTGHHMHYGDISCGVYENAQLFQE